MNFLKKKNNVTIILFLITVIIISHFFVFYIGPFINAPAESAMSLPFDEAFTVNATLLNTDGSPKMDAKNNPMKFQLDICGNDPNFQSELNSQINSYVKTTFNDSILPSLSNLHGSLTQFTANKN